MKKKILLFGPIGDFGGRELECGFIAHVLSSKYDVEICSSSSLSGNSQLFTFNKNQKVFSLNDLLCDKYYTIKILSFLGYLKNRREGIVSEYANNRIAKKYFGYKKRIISVLAELLPKYDLVFICAQFTTGLMDEVVSIAKINNKKVIFRTTGTINNYNYNFLNNVDCYIHHSINNANKLQNIKKHNYQIIDQCAFDEKNLLTISLSESNIKRFLVLSRLSPEKGIEQIIEYFLRVYTVEDVLFVAGNGVLEEKLKNKYKDLDCIQFLGFVDSFKYSDLFQTINCLIIPSPEETGPLVGIESMCAGKIIISTRVGAMPERLNHTLNEFWYDYDDFESFKKVFNDVKSLDESQIKNIAMDIRNIYKKKYSINNISEKYLEVVNTMLK